MIDITNGFYRYAETVNYLLKLSKKPFLLKIKNSFPIMGD